MPVVQPLPLTPSGSVVIADGISFREDDDGTGCVFVWGLPTWSWDSSDKGLRRLCAVQIFNSNLASPREVANAFGVNETTLWRWRNEYSTGSMVALLTDQLGPKRPSKLDDQKIAELNSLPEMGNTLLEIADMCGVSTDTVRRGISSKPQVVSVTETQEPSRELVPLATPLDRTSERQLARSGILDETPVVICEGASLPLAGSIIILPAWLFLFSCIANFVIRA